jgi:hypothetical protein
MMCIASDGSMNVNYQAEIIQKEYVVFVSECHPTIHLEGMMETNRRLLDSKSSHGLNSH